MKSLYELHNPGLPSHHEIDGLSLLAFSISGLATYVLIPAFDACFDLGHCPAEALGLRHVFLSHVHQDHAAGAPRHLAMRVMTGQVRSKIYLPAESAADFIEMMRALYRMEKKPDEDWSRIVFPVAPGESVKLSNRYRVAAFDVSHRVASRGYTVWESRRRLLPAFQGLPGEEIGAAVRRGEAVYAYNEIPRFTYIGDSVAQTLRDHPELGDSEILFLESTHLGDTSTELSERYGHLHLDEIVALWEAKLPALQAKHLILKHFSMRYRRSEIEGALQKLPASLKARLHVVLTPRNVE